MFIDESVITVISGNGGDGAATSEGKNLSSLADLTEETVEKVEM